MGKASYYVKSKLLCEKQTLTDKISTTQRAPSTYSCQLVQKDYSLDKAFCLKWSLWPSCLPYKEISVRQQVSLFDHSLHGKVPKQHPSFPVDWFLSNRTRLVSGALSFEELASAGTSGPLSSGKLFLPAFVPLTLSLCNIQDGFIQ